MSNLFSATNANSIRTWNGMRTLETSLSSNVDLYYKWGGSRGKFDDIKAVIAAALASDKDLAVRTLLWGRDVREGAGERQLFRDAIEFIASGEFLTIDEARRVMVKIPFLGRWDDLFIFVGTVLENEAFSLLAHAIFDENNALAAKWTPRKGPIANKFRKFLELSPKQYRKALVSRTHVVEQAMCAKNWDEINFSHVPSVAAGRYIAAFKRNAPEAYAAYKAALVKTDPKDPKPEVKINAGAVYPYDVIRALRVGDVEIASKQWEALPDYMSGSEYSGILPVIDTSGSMSCAKAGGGHMNGHFRDAKAAEISCLDVAISLGVYLSERNRGVFKDEFVTFSTRPKMVKLTGDLKHRYEQLAGENNWEGSTNLHAVFVLMLNSAKRANLPAEDLPKTILIISDMQFNSCVRHDDTAHQMIVRKYKEAGYPVPNVVFWNVNTANGVPVSHDQHGTALVSGFSPSIVKAIIRAEEFTPEAVMKQTVMSDRYAW